LLLENTRFYAEEIMNRAPEEHAKSQMVKKLSPLFDLFINDAFSVSSRLRVNRYLARRREEAMTSNLKHNPMDENS
jgi:3-phosphoglycerate kinase